MSIDVNHITHSKSSEIRPGILGAYRVSMDGYTQISTPNISNPSLDVLLHAAVGLVNQLGASDMRIEVELDIEFGLERKGKLVTISAIAKRFDGDTVAVAIEQGHSVAKSIQRILRRAANQRLNKSIGTASTAATVSSIE